jgi:hypothetical protein
MLLPLFGLAAMNRPDVHKRRKDRFGSFVILVSDYCLLLAFALL